VAWAVRESPGRDGLRGCHDIPQPDFAGEAFAQQRRCSASEADIRAVGPWWKGASPTELLRRCCRQQAIQKGAPGNIRGASIAGRQLTAPSEVRLGKAQNKSALMFAGECIHVEIGVTTICSRMRGRGDSRLSVHHPAIPFLEGRPPLPPPPNDLVTKRARAAHFSSGTLSCSRASCA